MEQISYNEYVKAMSLVKAYIRQCENIANNLSKGNSLTIGELNLSVRLINCLHLYFKHYLKEDNLFKLSISYLNQIDFIKLRKIRGFGKTSEGELKIIIAKYFS